MHYISNSSSKGVGVNLDFMVRAAFIDSLYHIIRTLVFELTVSTPLRSTRFSSRSQKDQHSLSRKSRVCNLQSNVARTSVASVTFSKGVTLPDRQASPSITSSSIRMRGLRRRCGPSQTPLTFASLLIP